MQGDTLTEEDTKLIEELVNDHEKFNKFVYTESLEEAMAELERRRQDPELLKKVEEYFLDVGIPEPFQKEPRLTIFRQVATPNLEISRFLIAADGSGVKPLFFEYHEDKFTSNNELKKYLGKIAFYEGIGKKGGDKIKYHTIIDFNESDGKKISEVSTHWGEGMTKFHRRLFSLNYKHLNDDLFFDASAWLKKVSSNAKGYYEKFLCLFEQTGILLENFVIDEANELNFCKEIFLPALILVKRNIGYRPLIVALAPTNIEAAEFWLCQNPKTKEWFEKNMLTL